jgi:hypothetical protein
LEPFILTLLVVFALSVVAVAVTLWDHVREWCVASLFPWIEHHLPWLAPHVRQAYAALDNAVVSVRRAVRQAWETLRAYLLHQVVELRRRTSSEWVCRVTSWVIKTLESGERKPVKIVTEEACHWDTLPADLRAQGLKHGVDHREAITTELRDLELAAQC